MEEWQIVGEGLGWGFLLAIGKALLIGICISLTIKVVSNTFSWWTDDTGLSGLCAGYGAEATMEKVSPTLNASLSVDCPHCGNDFDVFDQDDGGNIMNPIFNNEWKKLEGAEVECPICTTVFELGEIIW